MGILKSKNNLIDNEDFLKILERVEPFGVLLNQERHFFISKR